MPPDPPEPAAAPPPRPTVDLTALGWGVLIGGLVLLAGGLLKTAPLVALVGAFLVGLVVVARFLARRNLLYLRHERRLPEMVMAGQHVILDLLPSCAHAQPACYLALHDEAAGNGHYFRAVGQTLVSGRDPTPLELPAVARRGAVGHARTVQFHRRGHYSEFRFLVESLHPFGLWQAQLAGTCSSPITVYPAAASAYDTLEDAMADGLAPAESAPMLEAGWGELRGLRDFTRGDALKQVAWRATARFGVPVVKEFDPETPGRYLLALHTYTTAPGGLEIEAFERGLETLTGLVIELAHSHQTFTFLAPWDHWRPIEVGPGEATLDEVLHSLAVAPLRRQTSLDGLAAALEAHMALDCVGWVVGPRPVQSWVDLLPDHDGRLLALPYGTARQAHREVGS